MNIILHTNSLSRVCNNQAHCQLKLNRHQEIFFISSLQLSNLIQRVFFNLTYNHVNYYSPSCNLDNFILEVDGIQTVLPVNSLNKRSLYRQECFHEIRDCQNMIVHQQAEYHLHKEVTCPLKSHIWYRHLLHTFFFLVFCLYSNQIKVQCE